MDAAKTSENLPGSPKLIQVHQQKSNFFRVVHADGVWFSVNPHKQIHLTFYSERYPLPTSVFFEVDENGIVTTEDVSKRETKRHWVREMEVSVSVSVHTAKGLMEALGRFIKLAEDDAVGA